MAKAKSQTKAKAEPAREAKMATTVKTTVRHTTLRKKIALREELVLGALLAEMAGVFVLTSVALVAGAPQSLNPLYIGLAVLFLMVIFARISGGHLNPAITLGMLVLKRISPLKAAGYVVAQVLGAMLALVVITQFANSTPTTDGAQAPEVFAITAVEQSWRPFFAEALGALILGIGVAAAVFTRRDKEVNYLGYVMIAGALFLGLIVVVLGVSPAVLNPAVAVGLSAYNFSNIWSVLAYAIGPVVGVIAGALFYKLMRWDTEGGRD